MRKFDGSYYVDQHEAVRTRVRDEFLGDALLDYLWVGSTESRNPSADFDEAYYLESNPDVAAALQASDFVCGYHHYLKNGAAEGRRGVKPTRSCVIDAGRVPESGRPAVAALVLAIQHARPGWRLQVLAAWNRPEGAGGHRWVDWAVLQPDLGDADETARAWQPDYVVHLAEPGLTPPAGAVAVGLGLSPGGTAGGVEVRLSPCIDPQTGVPDAVRTADRIATALETAEQVKAAGQGSRLIAGGSRDSIGSGVEVVLPRTDSSRVVSIAIELPPGAGVSKELLVLDDGSDPVELEVTVGRPAHMAVRVGADAARILVRPRKAGYLSVSRVAMARVEATPVDLVTAPVETARASDPLAVIDLNADLARAKRELGRFLEKADALVRRRPAFEFGLPAVPRLAPVTPPRCLVVSTIDVERSWVTRDTLDVSAWREYLEARGFAVDLLDLPMDSTSDAGRLRKRNLEDHRFVVLTSPRAAAALTEGVDRCPHLVRVYRGAVSGSRTVEERLRADDLACARAADRVVVDGVADAAYYRNAGVPAGHIDYVPEFLPAIYRRPVKPYDGRPRQVLVHVDTEAVLEGRIRRHQSIGKAITALAGGGWRVVVSASPRLRARIEDDLELDGVRESLDWCDAAVELPQQLHSTRLVLAPAVDGARIGGLISAARVLGFKVLLDGPVQGPVGPHVGALPADLHVPGGVEKLDRDPGARDMEAVRAEAYRALDRVLGFRDAGWQEGRRDRSPDI